MEKGYLFLRKDDVLEGIESRTHLNMRPQIRHILRLDLAKLWGNSWSERSRVILKFQQYSFS
jgi:hypothetical protein